MTIAEKIKQIKEVKIIQEQSITNRYMLGLYNGIELSIAILEDRSPEYKENKDYEF